MSDQENCLLTDEEDIPDAVRKLQVIYPNLMKLDYDNQRTRGRKSFADVQEVEEKTPFDIFEDLYEKQNNHTFVHRMPVHRQ